VSKLVYLADFRAAASSATEPASRAAAATYESANGHTTVTSRVSGFPAEIKVTLSQKCCMGTVQTAMSHVCSHGNSYGWCNHVRSSLKDALNSSVFICRLNAMYDSVVLSDAGRAFQARAAVTGNLYAFIIHLV